MIFFIITMLYLLLLLLVAEEINLISALGFLVIYLIFVGIAVFQSKLGPSKKGEDALAMR